MHVRFVGLTLIFSLLIPQVVWGGQQAVSPSELQQAIAAATKNRQKNLDDVRSFFSSEPVKAALKSGKIDYRRVDQAVRTLSPQELERLAARTQQLQSDFAAGALSNQEITYILIALGAAVIVLIAVH